MRFTTRRPTGRNDLLVEPACPQVPDDDSILVPEFQLLVGPRNAFYGNRELLKKNKASNVSIVSNEKIEVDEQRREGT